MMSNVFERPRCILVILQYEKQAVLEPPWMKNDKT